MKYFVVIVFLFYAVKVNSQMLASKIDDPDYKNRLALGLQVGDKMPDLNFEVVRFKKGKHKISDYKGKLIIFDFWNTWCKPCIEAMPKMERLQQELDGKIQIFLINPVQTWEEISKLKNINYPNLPMIVKDSFESAEKIYSLFPSRSTGHQVWIGPDGYIKLRGAPNNNYSEKIQDVLSGKKVFMLRDNATAPRFDPSVPYFKILPDFVDTKILFNSSFTRFNNEYEPETFGVSEGLIDSASKTRRYTYVNVSALTLYSIAFQKYLLPLRASIIYGPYKKSKFGMHGYNTVIIPSDTLLYTTEFLRKIDDDKLYTKSKFCYEQIVPWDLEEGTRLNYMLDDLNKYMGSLYGTRGKVEQREVYYYALVKMKGKSGPNFSTKEYKKEEVLIGGNLYDKFTHIDIKVIADLIEGSQDLMDIFSENANNGGPSMLFNETGITNDQMVDIVLPKSNKVHTIADLIGALNLNGLELVTKKKNVDFIILTDNYSH